MDELLAFIDPEIRGDLMLLALALMALLYSKREES